VSESLIEAARSAQLNAHAPYSGYRVGAALEADDGAVFHGANVENASYGLSTCAERVALGAAVATGRRRFRRIAIMSDSTPPAAPCGACRQALAEFGLDLEVLASNGEVERQWSLRELLPDAFGPGDLGR
jgi:cytidine deaminase